MNDKVILALLKKADEFLKESSINRDGEAYVSAVSFGQVKGIVQSLIEEFSGRVQPPPPAGTDS